MATSVSHTDTHGELDEIIKLMWGSNVKEDVFQRWTQGRCNISMINIYFKT